MKPSNSATCKLIINLGCEEIHEKKEEQERGKRKRKVGKARAEKEKRKEKKKNKKRKAVDTSNCSFYDLKYESYHTTDVDI